MRYEVITGTKILYTSTFGGVQNIWIKDLPDKNLNEGRGESVENPSLKANRLTNYTTGAFDPRWAGNDKIVFSTFENKKLSVRLINNADTLIASPTSTTVLKVNNPLV